MKRLALYCFIVSVGFFQYATVAEHWDKASDTIFPVLLTIEISGAKDVHVALERNKVHFSGTLGKTLYALDLELQNEIDDKTSTWANRDRGIELVLEKTSAGFWHSLVKDHQKSLFKNQMKTDWQLFMDEDDLDEERKRKFGAGAGNGGMFDFASMMGGGSAPDFASMMGGQGLPSMGDSTDSDSMGDEGDDDEIPSLEDEEVKPSGGAEGAKKPADEKSKDEAKKI